MLDKYHEFMNELVLKPIGCNYYDLLERGLAIEVPFKDVHINN